MVRWILATLAFLAIGWLDYAYGHRVALGTMLVLLILVAAFGGHGPRRRQDAAGPGPNPDAKDREPER